MVFFFSQGRFFQSNQMTQMNTRVFELDLTYLHCKWKALGMNWEN